MKIKNLLKISVCIALCLCIGLSLAACGNTTETGVKKGTTINLGSGENNFRLLVKIGDDIYRTYNIKTDEIMLGDALDGLDLIEVVKDTKDYGTYTSSVAGKKFDIKKDKKYWMVSAEHCPPTSNPFVVDILCGSTYIYEVETLNK